MRNLLTATGMAFLSFLADRNVILHDNSVSGRSTYGDGRLDDNMRRDVISHEFVSPGRKRLELFRSNFRSGSRLSKIFKFSIVVNKDYYLGANRAINPWQIWGNLARLIR